MKKEAGGNAKGGGSRKSVNIAKLRQVGAVRVGASRWDVHVCVSRVVEDSNHPVLLCFALPQLKHARLAAKAKTK